MRGGYFPLLSSTYIIIAMAICLTSLTHPTRRAFSLAVASAGKSNPARMAMMAMTTSSSIKVNAWPGRNTAVKDGNATFPLAALGIPPRAAAVPEPDRKSTRLNSSHTVISYAVFCLKKKNHVDGPLTLALEHVLLAHHLLE